MQKAAAVSSQPADIRFKPRHAGLRLTAFLLHDVERVVDEGRDEFKASEAGRPLRGGKRRSNSRARAARSPAAANPIAKHGDSLRRNHVSARLPAKVLVERRHCRYNHVRSRNGWRNGPPGTPSSGGGPRRRKTMTGRERRMTGLGDWPARSVVILALLLPVVCRAGGAVAAGAHPPRTR